MKNVIFDLGGVVFARDMKTCREEFIRFFAFVRQAEMPWFWTEYDRGALTLEQTIAELAKYQGADVEYTRAMVDEAIALQQARVATEKLIYELKEAGYKLYVLSNMSKEFIAFLRNIPVYRAFDGEVVSCEEHTVKPEPAIYECLLSRYALEPSQSIFIDDRKENIEAAEKFGIRGFLFDAKSPEKSCDELRELLLKA